MPASPVFRTLGLLLLVLLARCGGPPAIDCRLRPVAELPMVVEDHLLIVPVGINGKWVRLVVDTGAERTTISDAAAERLGLPHDPSHRTQSIGVGGATTTTDVTVDRMVLGGVRFPVSRIAVGMFTLQNERGLNADGLLGSDILLAFDMDIDVPDGKITLYRPRICPDARPPWHQHPVEITGVQALKDRILLPFELDNLSGMAVLDTGAQLNVLGVNMARRMGLNNQTMAGDTVVRQRGVGPSIALAHLHRFRLLRVGPIAEESPLITVLPSDFGIGDALLGEEFLEGRRVWLSFHDRQVFISARDSER